MNLVKGVDMKWNTNKVTVANDSISMRKSSAINTMRILARLNHNNFEDWLKIRRVDTDVSYSDLANNIKYVRNMRLWAVYDELSWTGFLGEFIDKFSVNDSAMKNYSSPCHVCIGNRIHTIDVKRFYEQYQIIKICKGCSGIGYIDLFTEEQELL